MNIKSKSGKPKHVHRWLAAECVECHISMSRYYQSLEKELDEVTEAISKFGYQDGTLASMCERFKTYCESQTRHLHETSQSAVTAVTKLTKQNEQFKEVLEFIKSEHHKSMRDAIETGNTEGMFLSIKAMEMVNTALEKS